MFCVKAVMMLTDDSGISFTVRSFGGPYGKSLEDGVEPDFFPKISLYNPDDICWLPEKNIWRFKNSELVKPKGKEGSMYV